MNFCSAKRLDQNHRTLWPDRCPYTYYTVEGFPDTRHLRRLNSVNRGAAPSPLVIAINAYILLIATYRGDLLWPGMIRLSRRGISTTRTTHLCNLIDKAVHLALRAALPVWRTTPNVVLHSETDIPPARILFEENRLRLAARLNSLDNRHPLRIRASTCLNLRIQK